MLAKYIEIEKLFTTDGTTQNHRTTQYKSDNI